MTSPFLPEPETDLVWTGPSLRALLPAASILLLTSVILLSAGPWLAGKLGVEHEWATFLLFWLVVILWVIACGRWMYRGSSYIYRLTDRAIHVDFGFMHPPVPGIPLGDITGLDERPWAWWFMNVGTVIIRSEDRPPVFLPGLARPRLLIEQISLARNRERAS
ncbi:hypothetical protein [Zavarzinella formosa]|uniref:hypothetical protein n=1 Tax=Zavarzinella formosa TaxID=360055 RepID=UPI0002ED6EFE|nr:hypothetical protein [Zavarzinella formosa]